LSLLSVDRVEEPLCELTQLCRCLLWLVL